MFQIFKLQLPDGTLRRLTFERQEKWTIRGMKSAIVGAIPELASATTTTGQSGDGFSIAYVDAENDLVTLGSDVELAQFIVDCEVSGKVPKFVIVAGGVGSGSSSGAAPFSTTNNEETTTTPPPAAATAAAPPPEVPPLVRLAQLLANPANIEKFRSFASSPIIWDAIREVSQGYFETRELGAISAGIAHLPAIRAVAMEFVEEIPELEEIFHDVIQKVSKHGFHGVIHHHPIFGAFFGDGGAAPHCGPHGGGGHPHPHPPPHPHGGGGGGGPHHHHHHGPHPPCAGGGNGAREIHQFVHCDGCEADFEMRRRSFLAQTMTRRGWIMGPRFKSTTLDDYDLCETCHKSEKFKDNGPFVRVPVSEAPFAGPFCGGGGGGGGWGPFRRANGPRGCRGGGGGGRFFHHAFHGNHCGAPPAATNESTANAAAATTTSTTTTPDNEKNPFDFKNLAQQFQEALSGEFPDLSRAISESLKTFNQEIGKNGAVVVEPTSKEVKPAVVIAQTPPKEGSTVSPTTKVTTAETINQEEDSSGASTSEEWEKVPNRVDPFDKWHDQLVQLSNLGFNSSDEYIEFLEQENGDLEKVINRIVRRAA